MSDHDEHLQMVKDCVNRESKLAEWERQFISSIGSQLNDGRALTAKQAERLNMVWNRVT